jgi:Glucose / Sorbosone dehydrogenase/FlgD Ig-like domain
VLDRPVPALLRRALALVLLAGPAGATTPLTTVRVATGLTNPVFVTAPVNDPRLFIVEQRSGSEGRIRIVEDGVLLARPFLRVGPVATGTEQGLLGLAFAPDYATSGRFYIHYNDAAGTTRLERYTVSADPDSANPVGTLLFSVAQPYVNHNGGWIAFGPDGDLWMALGDGGSGGDPGDRAQNIEEPLGKILRFDVSGNGVAVPAPDNPFAGPIAGHDAVWCYGLRNPWRCSFDRQTGDFIIADVGQSAWEEIDFAPASTDRGKGWDWGWRCYEGNAVYTTSSTIPCGSCTAPGCDLKFPVWVYGHTLGRCSVTGGYVYRGCAIPDLQGTYFFADYCGAQIYSGNFENGTFTNHTERTAELAPGAGLSINSISSFGEDAAGELYICDLGGEVFKIVPAAPVLESDMPQLQVPTVAGDTLGTTGAGNVLGPGIVPFTHPGSRIRGVGYLKDAGIRDCPQTTPGCLVTHQSLGAWDIDLTACVDADSALLGRAFVFTNRAATAQQLVFVDVAAPHFGGDPDLGRAYGPAASGSTPTLTIYDADSTPPYLTLQGEAAGATFELDIDDVDALEARIAADQPLTGQLSAGPGTLAMAIAVDAGVVPAGASRTVMMATRILRDLPTSAGDSTAGVLGPALEVVGPVPFRTELQLAFRLPLGGPVRIDVFDARGRRVRRLVEGRYDRGRYPLRWDGRDDGGRDLGSGLYFVRLRITDRERTVRVVKIR